jgi:hypothetical protein
MANQSESTSPKAGKSRLRMGTVVLMTGKNVVRPGECRDGNSFKRSIVFMASLIGDAQLTATARVWDFVIPR